MSTIRARVATSLTSTKFGPISLLVLSISAGPRRSLLHFD